MTNSYSCFEPLQKVIVSGVLVYFPENVQSREAWYGHNFMMGTMPIYPAAISKEALLEMVGKRVKVTGYWYDGTEWHNDGTAQKLPAPIQAMVNSNPQTPIMRNEGVRVTELELLKKQ